LFSAKKHIAPLFLIGILCSPVLLFLYLQIHQEIVRHEMVEKLEHAELETITLHNNAVRWYKKNKEIVVNSTLFDVHRCRVVKDSTVFIGLFDIKETALKDQVKKLLEQRDVSNPSRELVIAKLLLQLWTIDNGNTNLSMLKAIILSNKHIVAPASLLTPHISIPFPPPKA
jgi:hypothetical protein